MFKSLLKVDPGCLDFLLLPPHIILHRLISMDGILEPLTNILQRSLQLYIILCSYVRLVL
jgi:hypothetical protein